MVIFFGVGIATLYGLISAFAGIIQLRVKKIPLLLALGMIIIGVGIAVTPYLSMNFTNSMALLIALLLLMHIIAILNGFYLYGKINIKHHILRLFISISIILLIL